MTYKNVSLLLLVLFLICGCSMFKTTPSTTYFDLGDFNVPESKNYGIDVMCFSSDLPASTKMVFRKESNEIAYDIYNNWAQTPQNILTKYLTFYFNNPHKQTDPKHTNNKLIIDGNIYTFECNMETKEAVLNVRVKLIQNEAILSNKIYSVRKKMAALTAFDFSKAMTQATCELAQRIERDINKLDFNAAGSTAK